MDARMQAPAVGSYEERLRGAWWFGRASWQQLSAGTFPSAFSLSLPSDPGAARTVVTITVAPFVEELLWRGTLFRKWRVRFGPRTALLVSSLLFGAMHDEKAK